MARSLGEGLVSAEIQAAISQHVEMVLQATHPGVIKPSEHAMRVALIGSLTRLVDAILNNGRLVVYHETRPTGSSED